MINRFPLRHGLLLLGALALTACASSVPPSNAKANARLTPSTDITRELTQLPEPRTKIPVAVYGLRDQTGQYKASPDSPYSTDVTQGAATMLVKALRESGWYIPVEREGLQNLLTERRIVRAIESPTEKGKPVINLPNLLPASLIIEGGITAYDSNVRTGGKGANFLGIGASTQYRVDQVTVGLRSIDIRTGQILNAVSVTKTIYSYQFDVSVYRFTNYKHLLQGETGYTTNEPAELAVREAIEAAVVHLTVQGVRERILELKNEQDWNSPVIQAYLKEDATNLTDEDTATTDELVPMRPLNSENPPQVVRPLSLASSETPSAKPIPDAVKSEAPPQSATVPVSTASQPVSTPIQELKQKPAPAPTPDASGAVATPEAATVPVSPANPPDSTRASSPPQQDATPTNRSSAVKDSSSTGDIFKMYRRGNQ